MKINTQEFRKLVYKTVPEKDFLRVAAERCNGCGKCAVVCPSILWRLEGGKARLTGDYRNWCLECGACWQACDPDAIVFDFPPGGSGIIVKYG